MTDAEASARVDQMLDAIAQEKYNVPYNALGAVERDRCIAIACARYSDAELRAAGDARKVARGE